MAKFNLDDYETVEVRLARFWKKYPEGRVLTDLVFHDERRFIVKAEIFFDRTDLQPVATGYAEEIVGASPVNRTSALENGETSAIGRALANCNFASEGKRPSRQEMEKVERYQTEPRKPVAPAPVTKAPEFSPEQLTKATQLIDSIKDINEVDVLRAIWTEHNELLEAKVNKTTLKDRINTRVKELTASA
jgi:hypothetical protein